MFSQTDTNVGMTHCFSTIHMHMHAKENAREAGLCRQEMKKTTNYKELARTHNVAPLAVETSVVFGQRARDFHTDGQTLELGHRWSRLPKLHDPRDFSGHAKRQCYLCAGHHLTMYLE